jgi:superfamily II RNA helicase
MAVNEDEYVQSFHWELMEVIYEWSQGKSFADTVNILVWGKGMLTRYLQKTCPDSTRRSPPSAPSGVSQESKMAVNEDEYVQSFHWELMEVIYEWSQGKSLPTGGRHGSNYPHRHRSFC